MDPITAVGFAASILTFIDFSWGIIAGTYEVYKSTTGTTLENAHISTVVGDLERATDGLISDVEGKTKHEKELCKLADKCHDLSQDLSKILKKLQVLEKISAWKSLKVKVASMRKEKEIASIEDRLDRFHGVDGNIYFIRNEPEEGPPASEQEEIEQPEHELFPVSLEELVHLREPKNLDGLLVLLLEKAKQAL